MIDAFTLAASKPWLLLPDALENILSVAQRMGDVETLQNKLGRPLDNTRNVIMRDGVAVIPVTGPIFRYANLFTEISGATSTGVLARDFQTALDNPYVRGIVLQFDSPGGEANGINELAKQVRAARGKKPIKAYAGGSLASGAYWLASAADEIIVDDIAVVGSIGAVMSFQDTSERDSKSGVRTFDIVSSQSPDKRIDPTTDDGREKVRALLDSLADVFVSTVAANRGIGTDKVLNDFGRGGVLVGAASVRAGMADRVGTLEAVIAELAGTASTPARKTPMSQNQNGQVTVSTTDDLRSAVAAGHSIDNIVIQPTASSEAIAAARADGERIGRQATTDTAISGERKRIADLRANAPAGFDTELNAAIESGASVEAFALQVLQTAKDRGITIASMRADAPSPAAHVAPSDGQAQSKPAVRTVSVFERRRAEAASKRGTG